MIFIVEDDEDIRDLTAYALESAGFTCRGYEDGAGFFSEITAGDIRPDLVLLDIMLPGEDGFAILKKIRANRKLEDVPVIMLTAKGNESDKVKGLNFGADDYVTKPFGVTELIARINAVLRRTSSEEAEILSCKDLVMDTKKRTVTVSGEGKALTFMEFELLRYLLLNAEIVLSRDKLMDAVWGYDYIAESRTVDMHIKTLRKKLGPAGEYIKTVRNVGYKIGD